jgi:hypothetical protein
MDLSKIINKTVYGIDNKNIFGIRIISGIIIGIEFTFNKPKYCIGFGDNSVWVYDIAETKEQLIELLNLPDIEKVRKIGCTHKIELNTNKNLHT